MWATPRLATQFQDSSEDYTSLLVQRISRRHEVFVDIGAHYGYFSLLANRACPRLEILAIEPAPTNYEILRRNLDLNRVDSATLIEAAVSDQDGQADFLISSAADNCGFYPHPMAPSIGGIQVQGSTSRPSNNEWLGIT